MSDMITAEEAEKHLDDFLALPGYLSEAITVGDLASRREEALRRYQGCAPALARTVIALHAQLADAKVAQAMVVERAAEECDAEASAAREMRNEFPQHTSVSLETVERWFRNRADAIRALADTDGLALVQSLRAEARESAMQALASMGQAQEAYEAQLKAEADRDRLAAANAALEAKLARLVGAAEPFEPGGFNGDIFYGDPVKTTMGTHRWENGQWVKLPTEMEAILAMLAEARRERDAAIRALAEVQADARREGGE